MAMCSRSCSSFKEEDSEAESEWSSPCSSMVGGGMNSPTFVSACCRGNVSRTCKEVGLQG